MGLHAKPAPRAKKTASNRAGYTSAVAGVYFRDDGNTRWIVKFRTKGKDYIPQVQYPVDLLEKNKASPVHVHKARADAEAYALKEHSAYMAHQRPMASFGANWTLGALIERVLKDFEDGEVVMSSTSLQSGLRTWVGLATKGHNQKGFPTITGKRLTELAYKDFFSLDGTKAFNKLLKDRDGNPASNSSVKKMIKAVQFALKRAKNEYDIQFDNPISSLRDIEANDARDRTLTHEEFDAIIKAMDDGRTSLATIGTIKFDRFTAVRRGEAIKLNWVDVDFQKKTAHLKGTKSRRGGYRERIIPVPKEAMDVLHELFKETKDKTGPVFAHHHAGSWKRISLDTPTQAWDRARRKVADKTGDPSILTARIHDLRHTRITEMGSIPDVTFAEAAAVSGHTDFRTFMRYFNPKPETIGMKLDAYQQGLVSTTEATTIEEAVQALVALGDKDAVHVAFVKAMEQLSKA